MDSKAIHAEAVATIEKALTVPGIIISGFSGATIHNFTDEIAVGGMTVPAGQYVAVDVRVLVNVDDRYRSSAVDCP